MMQPGRDEAMSIFRTWAEDRAMLRCDVSFRVLAARLSARIVSASDNDIRLLSEEPPIELALRIVPGCEFAYGDMRSEARLSHTFIRTLIVFLPPVGEPGDGDYVSFVEIKE
jgi:hypothetical protein